MLRLQIDTFQKSSWGKTLAVSLTFSEQTVNTRCNISQTIKKAHSTLNTEEAIDKTTVLLPDTLLR